MAGWMTFCFLKRNWLPDSLRFFRGIRYWERALLHPPTLARHFTRPPFHPPALGLPRQTLFPWPAETRRCPVRPTLFPWPAETRRCPVRPTLFPYHPPALAPPR